MKKAILILAVLLATPLSALAQVNGTVSSSGKYTYRNGLWWDAAGVGYTQSIAWTTGSYVNGCYQPGYRFATYTAVQQPQPSIVINNQNNTLPPPTQLPPDWRDKVLDIVAAQKKAANTALLKGQEQASYMEALQFLGLQNSLAGGYGFNSTYAGGNYGAYLSGQYTVSQGSTLYYANPYGVQQLLSQYSDNNQSILEQAVGQHLQQLNASLEKANFGAQGLIGQRNAGNQKVAEILAKAIAAENVLKALNGPDRQETYRFEQGVKKLEGGQQAKAAQQQQSPALQAWVSVASQTCSKCHAGDGQNTAQFNLEDYPYMNQQQRQKVLNLIFTADSGKRMPRGGPALTSDQAMTFLNCPTLTK